MILQYIQLALLLILVDRSLIIRNRYKFAIEHEDGYFAFWIYCKQGQSDAYSRYGGKFLFHFNRRK